MFEYFYVFLHTYYKRTRVQKLKNRNYDDYNYIYEAVSTEGREVHRSAEYAL